MNLKNKNIKNFENKLTHTEKSNRRLVFLYDLPIVINIIPNFIDHFNLFNQQLYVNAVNLKYKIINYKIYWV